jgi:hypothetical protein
MASKAKTAAKPAAKPAAAPQAQSKFFGPASSSSEEESEDEAPTVSKPAAYVHDFSDGETCICSSLIQDITA